MVQNLESRTLSRRVDSTVMFDRSKLISGLNVLTQVVAFCLIAQMHE